MAEGSPTRSTIACPKETVKSRTNTPTFDLSHSILAETAKVELPRDRPTPATVEPFPSLARAFRPPDRAIRFDRLPYHRAPISLADRLDIWTGSSSVHREAPDYHGVRSPAGQGERWPGFLELQAAG